MRVLFLYPRNLDADSSVGGVEGFLCALIPALKASDIESFIYASHKTATKLPGSKQTAAEAITLSKPKQVLAETKIYNGSFVKPGWFVSSRKLATVLDLCRTEKIDVIHAQGTYTAGFLAYQIHKRTGIPFVVTSHSDILATNSKRMNRRNVRRRCKTILQHASAVTHLTPMMKNISHELHDTSNKSTVIGNGIDCQSWQCYTNQPERDYMLGIGRLERGKGFDVLIEMYARLVARGVTTSLVIAGKGGLERNLFNQVKQLGLNLITHFSDFANIPEKSVIFTGYVRDQVKMRLIAESKIVLFATQPRLWEEAFGMVQLEAMAAGKALIASDTNVTRYLQQCGMQCQIIEPDNVNDWVNQTELLLNNHALRQQLGRENLQAAKQFDWQPIANQYRDVYMKLSKG